MERKILAIAVAMITAVAIVYIAYIIGSIFAAQPPKNLEYLSAEEKTAYAQMLPVSAFLTFAFGYVLSSVAAGWLVTKISKETHGLSLPLIVGGLLSLGGIFILFVLPGQPSWFIAASFLIFIPFSLLGHRIAQVYLRP